MTSPETAKCPLTSYLTVVWSDCTVPGPSITIEPRPVPPKLSWPGPVREAIWPPDGTGKATSIVYTSPTNEGTVPPATVPIVTGFVTVAVSAVEPPPPTGFTIHVLETKVAVTAPPPEAN